MSAHGAIGGPGGPHLIPRSRSSILGAMTVRVAPPRYWGARPEDVHRPCPGSRFAPEPAERWFRAIEVEASVPTVYRWLCQLKVAPYSYDLIDNLGRRSPRALTEGADRIEVGQTFMTIFELVDFKTDSYLTLKMTDRRALRLFGPFVVVYEIEALDRDRSRLLATLLVGEAAATGPVETVRRRALAWGDLLMMRKQLKTLKSLAEA